MRLSFEGIPGLSIGTFQQPVRAGIRFLGTKAQNPFQIGWNIALIKFRKIELKLHEEIKQIWVEPNLMGIEPSNLFHRQGRHKAKV